MFQEGLWTDGTLVDAMMAFRRFFVAPSFQVARYCRVCYLRNRKQHGQEIETVSLTSADHSLVWKH